MRLAAAVAATLLLLAGCAERGGGDGGPPVGAAVRPRQGAEPLATPPPDIGNADDPAPAATRPN